MAHKWDNDFDFEETDTKDKKKQIPPQKKINKTDDIFDFDQDQPKQKQKSNNNNNNNRGQSVNQLQPNNNKNIKNSIPYIEKITNKNNHQIDDQDDYNQPNNVKNKENKILGFSNKNNINKQKVKDENEDEQYYEEVFEQLNNKKDNNKNTKENTKNQVDKQEENEYGQQEFEEDNYGEDFQQPQQKKKPQKTNNAVKNIPKGNLLNSNKNNNHQQYSISKPLLQKNNSKKSLKSHAQQKSLAHSSHLVSKSDFIPNKYKTLVSKQFPQNVPLEQNEQKLIKLNDRIRKLIKKLNDQLNALIDKNLLQLKAKKGEKIVGIDERIKILQQQKKNNETIIERMESQFEKLSGRQGQLKQQQYQIIIQNKIKQVKQKTIKTQKQIIDFKFQIKNEGKKLIQKNDDKKQNQQLSDKKNHLIQAKREDQRDTKHISKLDQKIDLLKKKLVDTENQLNKKLQEAKNKGIQLYSQQQTLIKHKQIKIKKQDVLRYVSKTQILYKGKADQLERQNRQIKICIQALQSDIKRLYNTITQKNIQSIKAIQSAQQNTKLMSNPSIALSLQEMKKQIQQMQIQRQKYEEKQQQNYVTKKPPKTPNSFKADKNQQKDLNQQNKTIINSLPIQPIQDQHTNKPNFLKKKKNDEILEADKKNEIYERVWKDEQEKKQSQDKKANEEKIIFQDKKQDDKKKPFTLKKNRNNGDIKIQNQQKKDIKKDQQKKQQQKQKNQQTSSIAPKMIKFKKNKNQDQQSKIQEQSNPIQKNIQQTKQTKQIKKQQNIQQQPVFVPKRLNLRRGQKKDDSYIPTIEKKELQIKKIEEPKKQQTKKQQYKPNFNLKVDDQYSIKKENSSSIKQQIQIFNQPKKQQTKPTFIKLRDRKKNQQNNSADTGYQPTNFIKENTNNNQKNQIKNNEISNKNPYEPIKLNRNNEQKQKTINNPYVPNQNIPKQQVYNPYVQKQKTNNPYAPKQQTNNQQKKQKQGPLKKQKIITNVGKQKLNIYDQVQDLTKANQFLNEGKIAVDNKKNEELNLNQMLGIKKENKKDDDDDLFGVPKIDKKKKKNNNDFFGDMDI